MKRYSQQTILPEIGLHGQQKLAKATVLVVGCGGLGVPLVSYLSAMGIGNITLIDADTIEASNLHRQFLFTSDDIGKLKVDVLAKRINQQNSTCELTTANLRINSNNDFNRFSNFDLICDCTDNVESRVLLNASAQDFNVPLVYAAVSEWTGYVTILNGKHKIQLEQLHPTLTSLEQKFTCSTVGVLPSICGTIATIQATETIKLLLNIPSTLDGSVLAYNGLNNRMQTFRLAQSSSKSC